MRVSALGRSASATPLRLEQAPADAHSCRSRGGPGPCQHAFERAVEAHDGLERQAVDEVDRHRLEAAAACCANDGLGFLRSGCG